MLYGFQTNNIDGDWEKPLNENLKNRTGQKTKEMIHRGVLALNSDLDAAYNSPEFKNSTRQRLTYLPDFTYSVGNETLKVNTMAVLQTNSWNSLDKPMELAEVTDIILRMSDTLTIQSMIKTLEGIFSVKSPEGVNFARTHTLLSSGDESSVSITYTLTSLQNSGRVKAPVIIASPDTVKDISNKGVPIYICNQLDGIAYILGSGAFQYVKPIDGAQPCSIGRNPALNRGQYIMIYRQRACLTPCGFSFKPTRVDIPIVKDTTLSDGDNWEMARSTEGILVHQMTIPIYRFCKKIQPNFLEVVNT